MYKQLDVGLSVYGAGNDDTAAAGKSTPFPPPTAIAIGGCRTKFSSETSKRHNVTTPKRCPACDNGFIREPDGYGCVQWTSCYRCGGTGEADD